MTAENLLSPGRHPGIEVPAKPGPAHKAAKLPAPKPTLHDLRHSHASMLIALDNNLVDIQRRLGHRKPDTTLRAYAHQWKYREAQRSQIGAQLDRLFAHAPASSQALPRQPGQLALPAAP